MSDVNSRCTYCDVLVRNCDIRKSDGVCFWCIDKVPPLMLDTRAILRLMVDIIPTGGLREAGSDLEHVIQLYSWDQATKTNELPSGAARLFELLDESLAHDHEHTHEVTLGGRSVHDEGLSHSHPHSAASNEHHFYGEEPAGDTE